MIMLKIVCGMRIVSNKISVGCGRINRQ